MEKRFEVVPVGVKYVCDKCEEGEMQSTGKNMKMADPPKFEHECIKCKRIEYFAKKYPTIEYLNKSYHDRSLGVL